MKILLVYTLALFLAVSCATVDDTATVSVTGSATVMMEPDFLRFSVTASALSPTTDEARTIASGMINEAILILKENGVADDDISTSRISVSPEYSWKDGESILTGQRCVYSLDIILRTVDTAGALFQSVSGIDGIEIGNIVADKENKDVERMKARSLAVHDAHDKASVYANAAGYVLGDLISISESSPSSSYGTTRLYAMAEASAPLSDSLEYYPGDISISDEVHVVYSLSR